MLVVKCKRKNDKSTTSATTNFWFEVAYELYLCNNHVHLLESYFGFRHIQVVQQSPALAIQGLQQVSGVLKIVALYSKMQLGDI